LDLVQCNIRGEPPRGCPVAVGRAVVTADVTLSAVVNHDDLIVIPRGTFACGKGEAKERSSLIFQAGTDAIRVTNAIVGKATTGPPGGCLEVGMPGSS